MSLASDLPVSPDYWENLWQTGQTKWDLRDVSPPLRAYVDQLRPEQRAGAAVLMPGCGNGYEALYLLENGFPRVTMLDIAPTAVAALRQRLDAEGPADWAERLQLVCGDFFTHEGPYDLILEQTFFCALDPSLRPAYVRQMHRLLKPGGRLVGLLFERDFEESPPFGGSRAEYEALFSSHFQLRTLAPCYNSVERRAGTELFFIFEKAKA